MRFIRAEYSIFIIAYTLYVINYGLNLVISFDGVSTSCPLWESEWMFSPSKSPQLTAKEESEQWSKLWETWFESLSELIPAVKEDFERLHSDIVLKFHLSKRLDYNKGKPLTKLFCDYISKIAITFNKLGIHGLSTHLYKLALYPKGTVGRNI